MKPTKLGDLQLSWSDIPFGEYAIAIYQDLNNNGVLDKNVFGYPSEPFGFSKNFKPRFSAPDFDDCKITFSGSTAAIFSKTVVTPNVWHFIELKNINFTIHKFVC